MKKIAGLFASALSLFSTTLHAQDEETAAVDSPLYDGAYIAPMGSYVWSNTDGLDDGFGGVLAAGYRLDWFAFEFKGYYATLSTNGDDDATEMGGTVGALVFPFERWRNLFLIVEAGGLEMEDYPLPDPEKFALTTFAGGLGHLFGFSWGNYEFALRAEALYRYGVREENYKPQGDIAAPNDFTDALLNVGLQLPLSAKAPPPPPPPPVEVVPVETPPDSDGDGVIDANDQCPGTPAGTVVDSVGCPVKPPCKPPEPGQRIDLSGCGVGDVIVLHGVTFEFDKATLTPNARTILDGVADSLLAVPGLQFEVNGHTDSKGSDEYNQRLSERRSESVVQYLEGRGVTGDRMIPQGFGESQPVADNETDEGRELNRRVELRITSSDGKVPVTAQPAEPAAVAAEPEPATEAAAELGEAVDPFAAPTP